MEDFASLSGKTIAELKQIVVDRNIFGVSRMNKRGLIESILVNSKPSSSYFKQCMDKPLESFESTEIHKYIKHKSKEEMCRDIAWMVDGDPDEYKESNCDRWIKNKLVNPKSLRKISPTGMVYKLLETECNNNINIEMALNGPDYTGSFESNRDMLLYYYLDLFNLVVFDGKLTGRLRIEWHSAVAGSNRTIAVTLAMGNGGVARIVLSELHIKSKRRLRDALIHELCHAAVRIIDGIKPTISHGPEWHKWTRIAENVLPGIPKITEIINWEIYHPDSPRY